MSFKGLLWTIETIQTIPVTCTHSALGISRVQREVPQNGVHRGAPLSPPSVGHALLPRSPTLPGSSRGPDPPPSLGSAVSPAGPHSPFLTSAAAALHVLREPWKAAPPVHCLGWPDPGLLAAPRALPERPKMTASSWGEQTKGHLSSWTGE